ncbi:MAG: hypothetical protein KF797_06765 [Flavobacteriales bacterium]|nr:hypothetical protein [Flavobacteriales bacterium]
MPIGKSILFRYPLIGFGSLLLLSLWALLGWAFFILTQAFFDGTRSVGLLTLLVFVILLFVLSAYVVLWRMPRSAFFDAQNETIVLSTFFGPPQSHSLRAISHWKSRSNRFFEWPSIVLYLFNGDYVALPAAILDNRINGLMRELALPFQGEETRAFMGFRGKGNHTP